MFRTWNDVTEADGGHGNEAEVESVEELEIPLGPTDAGGSDSKEEDEEEKGACCSLQVPRQSDILLTIILLSFLFSFPAQCIFTTLTVLLLKTLFSLFSLP